MTWKIDHDAILPGHLLVGEAPRAEHMDHLKELGVTAVMSLLDHTDPYQVDSRIRQAFAFEEVSIVDAFKGGVPSTAHLERAVTVLRAWRKQGHVIYLHCLLGIGRSPLVAMAYLVAGNDEERDPKEHRLTRAIHQVRSARQKADPNVHQLKVLAEYVADTFGNQGKLGRQVGGRQVHEDPGDLHRFKGALVGLAVGDAVGTTLEFMNPGSFEPLTDMVGGGPFNLVAGQWTDDTSMAMCLAESLVVRGRFDPQDQMTRYVRWHRDGHWSVKARCFDIGNTVQAALARFVKSGDPFCGSTDPRTAGNGSLMRLAPVPMAFWRDPERALELAGESSRTTHGATTTVDACRYFAGLIVGAIQGRSKEELLAPGFTPCPGEPHAGPYCPEIQAIAEGSFKRKQPPQIRGTGYVVNALEAALWAFHHAEDFESGCLLAANLGDDADTTAAIYGQLAGAFHGLDGIPERWRERLAMRGLIEGMADDLWRLSGRIEASTEDPACALT